MPRTDEIAGALRVAEKLLREKAPPAHSVKIDSRKFDVFARKSPKYGWVTVLVQNNEDGSHLDHIRKRYQLTVRQLQIASMLAERYSNREIAGQLGIAVSTTKRHVEQIIEKLGVESRRDVRARLLRSWG